MGLALAFQNPWQELWWLLEQEGAGGNSSEKGSSPRTRCPQLARLQLARIQGVQRTQ